MGGSHSESDHVTLVREKVRLLDVVSKKNQTHQKRQ